MIYATLTLAVVHLLAETLRERVNPYFLALLVAGGAYALYGVWHAWPIPLAALLLFLAVRSAHRMRPASEMTAMAWGTLQVLALATALVLAGLSVRLMGFPYAPSEPPSAWPVAVYVAATALAGLLASVGLGGAFMNAAIRPFAVQMKGEAVVEAGGKVIEPLENGFKDGGRVIGYYERLLIFLFVLAEAPTAIGFLVAAKSILRFGDIRDGKDRKAAEYVIIGTLMSFAYALVVAYLTRLVLNLLLPAQP